MMAMSVNRRIERTLSVVMGQRDPEVMIRVRSTDPIRASGLVPRQQAGHMTASDFTCRSAKKILARRGPSTHDGVWGAMFRRLVYQRADATTLAHDIVMARLDRAISLYTVLNYMFAHADDRRQSRP